MGILEQVCSSTSQHPNSKKFPLDKRIMKIFLSLVPIFVFVVAQTHADEPIEVARLEVCINKCEDNECAPDLDKTVGCNQMYSCSHACVMRSRGVPRDRCIANCQRNGQSGCNPRVNGKTFDLCRGCNRQGCSRFPTVGECVAGCFYYVNF